MAERITLHVTVGHETVPVPLTPGMVNLIDTEVRLLAEAIVQHQKPEERQKMAYRTLTTDPAWLAHLQAQVLQQALNAWEKSARVSDEEATENP
jgi:hypothetical protein